MTEPVTAERKLLPDVRDGQLRLAGQFAAIGSILKDCNVLPGDKLTRAMHDQLTMLANKAFLAAWEYADE